MRLILVGLACVALSVPLSAFNSLDTPLDTFAIPSPLPRCGLSGILMQLAIQAGILLGFESVPECLQHDARRALNTTERQLENVTARQVLHFLLTLAPEYRWQNIGGIAVVRPAAAWTDAKDVLNFDGSAFQLTDGRLKDGLDFLFDVRTPDVAAFSRPDSVILRRFSVTFAHGTLLEGLNALIRAHESAMWGAGVQFQKNRPMLVVHFYAHDRSGFGERTWVDRLRPQPSAP